MKYYTNYVFLAVTLLLSVASAASINDEETPIGVGIHDPLCPYPSDVTLYLPNPSNCAGYIECFQGRKFNMVCNPGLYWNQEKLSCDYEANVNCNAAALCAYEPDGAYIPDPTDCSKFYECLAHKPYAVYCPSGTLWNKNILACDFPQNVKC